jgi:predicted RNase H-like nuclease (RuvC/YqgF family)
VPLFVPDEYPKSEVISRMATITQQVKDLEESEARLAGQVEGLGALVTRQAARIIELERQLAEKDCHSHRVRHLKEHTTHLEDRIRELTDLNRRLEVRLDHLKTQLNRILAAPGVAKALLNTHKTLAEADMAPEKAELASKSFDERPWRPFDRHLERRLGR